ncbi:GNAT family N-acetyltransferase [Endozoicomonas sp. OPT23]|uniref:GNAT family N-acetyltransferase n=1 Tax=Endozoicomonas sp. OPT23 TaxID=2072845 RepID=UPI00129AB890|nr:GNAT family N-acetyltransferase [Endozoicomonas sp. OPT23]MRI35498.1 GNAT family N-acetyltransferase [Endozoicomonas sp. OPT23]
MSEIIEIETKRLFLRQWKESDFELFAVMNSDEKVMEFFPAPLSRSESDERAIICQTLIAEKGWGFWALEEKSSGRFIGFTGLHTPSDDLPFSPCVEIGWRLSPDYWGKGFVTEAAKASLNVAFTQLKLDEIVSFTVKDNFRSLAVMERLGMSKQPSNFDHPALPEGHKLRKHSWYKIKQSQWSASAV